MSVTELGLKELIGKECRCIFDLPAFEWPIAGFPAWVVVNAVDMPMIKLSSKGFNKSLWVNVKFIKQIEA